MSKIQRVLNREPPPPIKRKKIGDGLPRQLIEIAAIRGVGFHRHLQQEGTQVFVTSLAEIDRIIDEKQRRTIETEEI